MMTCDVVVLEKSREHGSTESPDRFDFRVTMTSTRSSNSRVQSSRQRPRSGGRREGAAREAPEGLRDRALLLRVAPPRALLPRVRAAR